MNQILIGLELFLVVLVNYYTKVTKQTAANLKFFSRFRVVFVGWYLGYILVITIMIGHFLCLLSPYEVVFLLSSFSVKHSDHWKRVHVAVDRSLPWWYHNGFMLIFEIPNWLFWSYCQSPPESARNLYCSVLFSDSVKVESNLSSYASEVKFGEIIQFW